MLGGTKATSALRLDYSEMMLGICWLTILSFRFAGRCTYASDQSIEIRHQEAEDSIMNDINIVYEHHEMLTVESIYPHQRLVEERSVQIASGRRQ
jgi:hypothetical protein